MKRKGFTAALLDASGKPVKTVAGSTVGEALKAASKSSEIATVCEPFFLKVEPFEWNHERCDICSLEIELCNCKLIEPDPHPHLRLVKGNPN